ncbi:MAG: acetylglutamate kinase [PVC group bacterium]
MKKVIEKAAVLIEALPYIQSFTGKIVVVKLGGSAMTAPPCVEGVLRDVVFMEAVKMKPLVVHGGGNAISRKMKEAGISPQFIEGLRITDREIMKIVWEVLSGINAELTEQIRSLGGRAEGFCSHENRVITARKLQPVVSVPGGEPRSVDLGFVGEVDAVDTKSLLKVLGRNRVPVIAPVGADGAGDIYNINGDLAAAALAAALKAEKLVFLTDVEGIMTREDESGRHQVLSSLKKGEIVRLLEEGTITGGMIPKATAGLHALEGGVKKVHIIDGRIRHSLLLEIFTDKGIGTEIVN